MEFCRNRTLKEAIYCSEINDEQQAKRMFHQIVEGVSHIHSQGIIHRDLKPANIFIGDNCSIKIGDFGLSTTTLEKVNVMEDFNEKSTQTTGLGTPFYIAPELLDGSVEHYDQSVDMFSLGIIYFEMCNHFGTAYEARDVRDA